MAKQKIRRCVQRERIEQRLDIEKAATAFDKSHQTLNMRLKHLNLPYLLFGELWFEQISQMLPLRAFRGENAITQEREERRAPNTQVKIAKLRRKHRLHHLWASAENKLPEKGHCERKSSTISDFKAVSQVLQKTARCDVFAAIEENRKRLERVSVEFDGLSVPLGS